MNRLARYLKSALQEPLTLFLLFGIALFGADRLLNGAPTGVDDPIVITASQQALLREAFHAERGREPDAAELRARLDRWIDEQVLYREALALGLDRKDLIVHRQLTQKMRLLMEEAAPLHEPSDAELQAWLDRHPQPYGRAPTLSFEQVYLGRSRHGENLAADAEKVGDQLRQQPDHHEALGDPFPAGTMIAAADPVQLRKTFGPDFAEAVATLPLHQWSGPIASSFGLHFVRPLARSAFSPATLAEVRDRVRVDLQLDRHEQATRETLDRLRRKYRIEVEQAAG